MGVIAGKKFSQCKSFIVKAVKDSLKRSISLASGETGVNVVASDDWTVDF